MNPEKMNLTPEPGSPESLALDATLEAMRKEGEEQLAAMGRGEVKPMTKEEIEKLTLDRDSKEKLN